MCHSEHSEHQGQRRPKRDLVTDSVTVVITTSPTPSAPSTDLLSAVIVSFAKYCPSLLACPVIVVFDTFDRVCEIPRLKKGQVTPEGARAYESYRGNVQELVLRTWRLGGRGRHSDRYILNKDEDDDNDDNDDEDDGVNKGVGKWSWTTRQVDAEFGSPGEQKEGKNAVRMTIRRATGRGDVAFIEPHARLGFALAVRSALREARTPYVWVHQHDWTLEQAVPLSAMVGVMQRCNPPLPDKDDDEEEDEDGYEPPPVRYIALLSSRMLRYADSGHVQMFPALRALTTSLRRKFRVDGEHDTVEDGDGEVAATAMRGLPLTPLFFWHDKPHLADRRHYLARVFSSRLAVGRGMFIEDSVGHRARDQMKEGRWARWGSWLYYPFDGEKVCVKHLHGRSWKGEEKMRVDIGRWKSEGRKMRIRPRGNQERTGPGEEEDGDIGVRFLRLVEDLDDQNPHGGMGCSAGAHA